MKLNLLLIALLCIAGALADKEKKSKADQKPTEPKPKREAPISGSGGYHGPSYKYLPPSLSGNTGGFDSYNSDRHSASGDRGGYEFENSGLGSTYSHGSGHFSSLRPKVETFIVKTETAQGHYGSLQGGSSHVLSNSQHFGGTHGSSGLHGLSGLRGLHSSHSGSGLHGGIGYKYAGPSISFGGDHGSHENNFRSSYAQSHGPVHKIKAIVIPAHGFSAEGHGSSGLSRFGEHNGDYSHSSGLASSSHYSNDIGGGHTGHGFDFSSGFNAEHLSGSDFPSAHSSHRYEQGNDYSSHSLEASYRESDHFAGQGGYSYETPTTSQSHGHSHNVPSSSYAGSSFLSPPQHSGNEAPSYAGGHKGLGHFGFAASKPQALHTNFIDSSRYGGSYVSHEHGTNGALHGTSNAPFKPSLFLGSSHEGNALSGAISGEYGPPSGGHNVSPQYLPPPTSNGYDYPPPSVLYGATSDGAGHGGPSGGVHEPENTYLPPSAPQTSYGPPATPSDSYLPPHH